MRLCFYWLLLGLLAWLPAASQSAPRAQPTVVYLVRHAEKDPAPDLADPLLTTAGEARAQALADKLAGQRPAALFTTNTQRTRATLAPLAQAVRLTPLLYNAKDPAALAARIRQGYAGRTVVVVGHSNTLLPLLAALGVQEQVPEIADNQYANLYRVVLAPTGAVRLHIGHYGKP